MGQLRFLFFAVGLPLVLVWGSWFGLKQLLVAEPVLPPPSCDSLLVQLNAEISNGLDHVLAGGETRCGTSGSAREVVECALDLSRDVVNPQDERLRAYVRGDHARALVPCQVEVAAVSRTAVRISQVPSPGAEPRSFRIVVE